MEAGTDPGRSTGVVATGPDRRTPSIHLLGGPYVSVAGARAEIPESGQRLLVFVTLNAGDVDRRLAAGTLWPTCSDVRAAGNLRSALWRLRTAGLDLLDTDRGRLLLRPGTDVDVVSVRSWALRLIDGSTRNEDLYVHHLRRRMTELLPGWYDDWVIFERERLRQLVMHAVEMLGRRLLAERLYAQAVEAAMAAVSADPFRESAVRVLVEAHLAEGNSREAHHAFARHEELVRRELGVEPTNELTSLLVERPPAGQACGRCPLVPTVVDVVGAGVRR